MVNFVIRMVINAISLWVASSVVSGVRLSTNFMSVLWVAIIFGFVNAMIRPILQFFSMPVTILTFGLFAIVINSLMLWLTAAFTKSLDVDGFGSAFWASIIISIVSAVLSLFLT